MHLLSALDARAIAASGLLLSAIWQGALLALATALLLRLAPRIPAAARFAIWFSVFALIAALPILTPATRASSAGVASAPHHAWLTLDARWTLAIVALWAAASLLRAISLITAAARVHHLWHRARPIDSIAAVQIGSRRAPVCASADVDRPTVIGFFSPRILVPSWLLEKLTPAELDHVVLHEAVHLRRSDDWLNLLQKLALVLFPLNPALAWVERRLCFERELACDERVLQELASRNDSSALGYASCLTTLAEYRLQRRGLVQNLALALGALGTSARQSELGHRIARILRPAARMSPLHVRLTTAVAIAALLFTTTELEHTTQLVSFTSPVRSAQMASAASASDTATGPGGPSYAQRRVGSVGPSFHAIPTRMIVPATAPKSTGDAAPYLAAANHRTNTPANPQAIESRSSQLCVDCNSTASAHLVSARQPRDAAEPEQPQPGLVITRYTVTAWQTSDGYRIVRTRAVVSELPAASDSTQQDTTAPQPALAGREKISQPVTPYASMPVPGGWLVFQL